MIQPVVYMNPLFPVRILSAELNLQNMQFRVLPASLDQSIAAQWGTTAGKHVLQVPEKNLQRKENSENNNVISSYLRDIPLYFASICSFASFCSISAFCAFCVFCVFSASRRTFLLCLRCMTKVTMVMASRISCGTIVPIRG